MDSFIPKILVTKRAKRKNPFGRNDVALSCSGMTIRDEAFCSIDHHRSISDILPFMPDVEEMDFISRTVIPELVSISRSGLLDPEDGFSEIPFDGTRIDRTDDILKQMSQFPLFLFGYDTKDTTSLREAFFSPGTQPEKGWFVSVGREFISANDFSKSLSSVGWSEQEIGGFVIRHEFSHAFATRRKHEGTFKIFFGDSDESDIFTRLIDTLTSSEANGIANEFALTLPRIIDEGFADCRALGLMPDLSNMHFNTLMSTRKKLCDSSANSSHETWRAIRHMSSIGNRRGNHESSMISAASGAMSFIIDSMTHSREIRNFVVSSIIQDQPLFNGLLRYHSGNPAREHRLNNEIGNSREPTHIVVGNLSSIARKNGIRTEFSRLLGKRTGLPFERTASGFQTTDTRSVV